MTYTSHGYMTAADLQEYRQDYDWDELNRPEGAEKCPDCGQTAEPTRCETHPDCPCCPDCGYCDVCASELEEAR